MKFLAAAAVAALAATAEAIVAFTNSAIEVQAGEPFTLTWTGATGPVTITLRNGPPGNLQVVATLDSDDTGTSFTWTPPANLPSDTYTFVIQDSIDQNYSKQFTFQGTASPSSTVETTASPSTSSPSSSTPSSSTEENSTTASASTSATETPSASPSTSATDSEEPSSVPSNTNDGQRYKSPLALVLVTVAALLYFN